MTRGLEDVELLSRLVAFDSTSRNSNLPIADFICDYLDRRGVRIDRNASPDGTKANLVIAAGPEDLAAEGLGLSGHMDVVPADEKDWNSDPFSLARVDDRLVGRGACDMKGFLALAMNRFFSVDPDRLRRPLALLFTYDEELGTLGAKHFVETWPTPRRLPRAVIVGEPTELRVVRMHKGYLKLRVTFVGRAAHSGYPHLGRNAIEPAGRAIVALSELRRVLETERPLHALHFPEVPFAALNVATITGGVAINVIPDHCQIEVGVRLLPEMRSPAIVGRIRDTLTHALDDIAFELTVLGESPAMLLEEDASLHRALCQAMGQTDSQSVSFATDAGWFQNIGLECVIFGPGSIEKAHRANEYMPLAELRSANLVLHRIVHDWCEAGS